MSSTHRDDPSAEEVWQEVALNASCLGIKTTRVVQSTQVPTASYGKRKTIDELTEEINEILPEGVTVEQYLAVPISEYEVQYLVPGGEWQETRSITFSTPEEGFAWIDDYVTDSDHPEGDEEERKCYRVVEVIRRPVRRPEEGQVKVDILIDGKEQ